LLDFGPVSLTVFAVFYGLDWIATVPPTARLTNLYFGERAAPIVLGWIFVGHQLGAATAAFGAGVLRQETGSYQAAFLFAGGLGLAAALAMLGFRPTLPRSEPGMFDQRLARQQHGA
jgi:sugar phosphate permease